MDSCSLPHRDGVSRPLRGDVLPCCAPVLAQKQCARFVDGEQEMPAGRDGNGCQSAGQLIRPRGSGFSGCGWRRLGRWRSGGRDGLRGAAWWGRVGPMRRNRRGLGFEEAPARRFFAGLTLFLGLAFLFGLLLVGFPRASVLPRVGRAHCTGCVFGGRLLRFRAKCAMCFGRDFHLIHGFGRRGFGLGRHLRGHCRRYRCRRWFGGGSVCALRDVRRRRCRRGRSGRLNLCPLYWGGR